MPIITRAIKRQLAKQQWGMCGGRTGDRIKRYVEGSDERRNQQYEVSVAVVKKTAYQGSAEVAETSRPI